jgi:hypothetical protein
MSISVRIGGVPGMSLRAMCDVDPISSEKMGEYRDTVFPTPCRIVVMAVDKGQQHSQTNRMLEFVSDDEAEPWIWQHGPFFVSGKMRIENKINNGREASEAWKKWRTQLKGD